VEYSRLGRSGLQISRLCLGTTNFGWKTAEADAFAIMDRAHQCGINVFDTANTYGGPSRKGETERMIGRWFSQGDGRRQRTVLATKVYNSFSDWPNDGGLSALNIRRSCDASLQRLGTDYIDLYQIHFIDAGTPWDEIWDAMQVLRDQGKVLYVGSANFAGWQVAMAQEAASKRNLVGLVGQQSEYNLLNRGVEHELLPACAAYGVGVLAYSPLQGGLLAGVLEDKGAGDRRRTDKAAALVRKFAPRLEAYEALCRDAGREPAKVAMGWLLGRAGITALIIGPRTVDQFEGVLDAWELKLDGDLVERLEEIFPPPERFRSLWDIR
jgi:aryl-alcohol dehydrogenase-like predicted oxidoreductase